ncbi:MAG: hypothetical protein II245_02345 [Bacteroidaceae bacterium]|nr:hypothetical protein [Bacteroidaceae bacterium]
MDQLEGYKKKQQEIAESLKIMEDEGKKATEEYKKLASNVEGWGSHLVKSLLS